MLARNCSCTRGQRQLLGLLLELLLGELDLPVLALDLVLLRGELARLLLELLVGLLQLLLLRLQLLGHPLRLAQQLVGAHRGLDRRHHDAEALEQLVEEGELDLVKGWKEASSMTPLTSSSKRIGTTTMLRGAASPSAEVTAT
jgi:hypothetical protein